MKTGAGIRVRASQRAARHRRRAGTSTVEMAIVLPLLLVLLFGIAEFGIAFTQWQTLTNAAREGARTGVVFRGPGCTPATVQTQIQQTVDAYVVASGLPAGSVSVTSTGVCTGSGTPLTVGATTPYAFQMLPGLAGLSSQVTLSATSVMRNE